LLVLEGDTESVFYPLVREQYLTGVRVDLRQIKRGGNINKKILAKIFGYTLDHPCELLRVYCCSDTDSNNNSPTPLDVGLIRRTVKERDDMRCVLSVDVILADPEIESWFFYDIEGIYGFLGAEKSKRNPRKYKNAGNLSREELQRLFGQFRKAYVPGNRAKNFIDHLDLNKIITCCRELRVGIERIQTQATNSKKHI